MPVAVNAMLDSNALLNDACCRHQTLKEVQVRALGLTDYTATWQAMQAFNAARHPDTPDEIWLTEHPPVYSLGLNKKSVKLPLRDDIPLVETDRGGKITYHAPGQVIIYVLIDLKRRGLTIRRLVSILENAVIQLLAQYGVKAFTLANAPGVYVADLQHDTLKIASLGLRVKNHCCYHGLSVNVNMDLLPFDAIDPCGFAGLKVTQIADLGMTMTEASVGAALIDAIVLALNTPNEG